MKPQLADGSVPASPDDVHARLTALGVDHSFVSHLPMRTVADSRRYRAGQTGGFSKNLFLRNKKGRMWLVTLTEDRVVDLRVLGQAIGAGRVSFGSTERLMNYLGVIPGAVSPLAVINDNSLAVTAWIDQALLAQHPLHFHPCENTLTTTLSSDGLLKYMQDCNHAPSVIDFSTL